MKKKVGSFGTQHIQHRVALSERKKKKSVLLVHNTFNIESHCLNEKKKSVLLVHNTFNIESHCLNEKKKSVLLVHNTFNIESHCLNENTHSPGKKVMIKRIKDKHVWLSLAVRYYFWMGFVDNFNNFYECK